MRWPDDVTARPARTMPRRRRDTLRFDVDVTDAHVDLTAVSAGRRPQLRSVRAKVDQSMGLGQYPEAYPEAQYVGSGRVTPDRPLRILYLPLCDQARPHWVARVQVWDQSEPDQQPWVVTVVARRGSATPDRMALSSTGTTAYLVDGDLPLWCGWHISSRDGVVFGQ